MLFLNLPIFCLNKKKKNLTQKRIGYGKKLICYKYSVNCKIVAFLPFFHYPMLTKKKLKKNIIIFFFYK